MSAQCSKCRRPLVDGDVVWADDWKVIEDDGSVRAEVRYTCDACEKAGAA